MVSPKNGYEAKGKLEEMQERERKEIVCSSYVFASFRLVDVSFIVYSIIDILYWNK